jgi:glutathione synthase/RimK-type ligase-like ATP-grasp enzyme
LKKLLVVIDKPEDWKPYFPSDQIISSREYLTGPQGVQPTGTRILNLCQTEKYLSRGYFVSLLAEARGHKVLPGVESINDLNRRGISDLFLPLPDKTLSGALDKIAIDQNVLKVRFYLGKTKFTALQQMGRQLFEKFGAPIMEVELKKEGYWKIQKVDSLALKNLIGEEEDLFASALENFTDLIWKVAKSNKPNKMDLAILVNPNEKLPPSDKGALKKFEKVAKKMAIRIDFINRTHYDRVSQFDALFIRESTSVDNHTYRFAKKAQKEGLVVIDDPRSILRCTNKVYLANLLKAKGVAHPRTEVVGREVLKNLDPLLSLGFPMVLKIPDGSFSRGVVKASNQDELVLRLKELLRQSDLILVQEYLYTEYDWRIGVLGGKPLFACKYFMSKGHWQIVEHKVNGKVHHGNFKTLALFEAPREVVKLAVHAASLIGDSLYGVDIKETNRGPVVVEVNDNPNLDSGVEDEYLGDELYRIILEDFLHRTGVR